MKKPNITEGEWKWQKFGDEYYLCGQYGMRPMVLATLDGNIAIRKDGLLEKLYPDHPDAKAISAVPDMMDALIGLVFDYEEDNDLSPAIKEAKQALKRSGVEL